MKRFGKHLILAAVVFVAGTAFYSCTEVADDAVGTTEMGALLAVTQSDSSVFLGSCDDTAKFTCENYTGPEALATDLATACIAPKVFSSTTRCTATGAISACTIAAPAPFTGASQERVYYTDFADPAGDCTTSSGTFSNSYSG